MRWSKGKITSSDWELYITDGATKIELNRGFLKINGEWIPNIATYKGGGTFQSSSLSDGRRMVDKRFNSVVERIPLIGSGNNVDGTIRAIQELRRLIEKASDYWVTEWYDSPVYLVAQSPKETNIRYATITMGSMPQDPFFYGNPFRSPFGQVIWNDLDLILERGHWQSVAPGSETALLLSSVETFSGVNYGNVDSTGTREPVTTGVYVANKYGFSNIDYAFTYSNGGTTFSSNLVSASLPYDLIDYTTDFDLLNNYVVFGSPKPFNSLIFDLTTVYSNSDSGNITLEMKWQYWSGAAWSDLTTNDKTDDGTNPFTVSGVNGVFWEIPSSWATTTVNSIADRYWVRCLIYTYSIGALTEEEAIELQTFPQQGNRDVYAVQWPYVELQSTALGGDIAGIAKAIISPEASQVGTLTFNLASQRVVMGLRSMADRGTSFSAYLNATDSTDYNVSGVTCDNVTLVSSFSDSVNSPTGRRIVFTPSTNNTFRICTFTIDNTIADQYRGRYLAFIRVGFTGTTVTDDFRFYLTVSNEADNTTYTSPTYTPSVSSPVANQFFICEFGELSLPSGNADIPNIDAGININVFCVSVDGVGESTYVYDLVLIPTDEFAIKSFDGSSGTRTSIEQQIGGEIDSLIIDSLTAPKVDIYSVLKRDTSGVIAKWDAINNGRFILQNNQRQRLWFLFDYTDASLLYDTPRDRSETVNLVKLWGANRYLSARGDR